VAITYPTLSHGVRITCRLLNQECRIAPVRCVTHVAVVADVRGTEAYRGVVVEELAFVKFLKVWPDWRARYNIHCSS
jgi:hypothetical protein